MYRAFEARLPIGFQLRPRVIDLALMAFGVWFLATIAMAFVSGASRPSTFGYDAHGPLEPGASPATMTRAGAQVSAAVLSVATRSDGSVVAEIAVESRSPVLLDAARWQVYLDDNTRTPAVVTATGDAATFRVQIPASVRERAVALHYNPDDSAGDLYFDLR